MSDLLEFSIHITVKTVDPALPNSVLPCLEDRLRCEMWSGCSSSYCQRHGCLNALRNQGKGAK